MNRKIRNIVWSAFLACAALEFISDMVKFSSTAETWLNSACVILAATVVLLEAVAHVGWRPALVAWLMVSAGGGAALWFGAPWLGLTVSGWTLLFCPLMLWCCVGGFYLTWHHILPVFDARVVAFLTAISTSITNWFAFRPASWSEHLAWLILAYFLARFIPLKGDSKPISCSKPLTVILIMALLFYTTAKLVSQT